MTHHINFLKSLLARCIPARRKRTGDYVPTRRYQLTISNMASLEDHVLLRGKRSSMIFIGAGAFVLAGLLWMLLLAYTPMRNLLPLRLQSELRNEYISLSERIDSVNEAMRINQQYVDNVLAVINDQRRDTTADDQKVHLAAPLPLDSLMEATHTERSFTKRFEEAERFNVSVLSPIAAEGMTFYPPVAGVEAAERVSDAGIPYVYVLPNKSMPISAVYRGTVLNASFITARGVIVTIQHPNNFVSIYTGLTDVHVARGDKVEPGQRIGVARDGQYPFIFELWHNGAPLTPKEYILF